MENFFKISPFITSLILKEYEILKDEKKKKKRQKIAWYSWTNNVSARFLNIDDHIPLPL